MSYTWGDLKNDIRVLGFEEDTTMTEYADIVISACNRAIQLINSTVRPILSKYTVSQYMPLNIIQGIGQLALMEVTHYEGTEITYTAENAKAYYFECDGNGTCTIVDDNGTQTLTLASDRKFVTYKGFLSGNATITFSGTYSYNIKNIAMYGILKSNLETDIPVFTRDIRYDIAELTKVNGQYIFQDFDYRKPIKVNGFSEPYKYIEDFKIEDRKTIVLNYFEEGEFTFWYKKRPTRLTLDTLDTFEIELDYTVQPLIPLLASHYIWLDDEERKATLYWNEYDDLKNQILTSSTDERKVQITGGI